MEFLAHKGIFAQVTGETIPKRSRQAKPSGQKTSGEDIKNVSKLEKFLKQG